MKIRNDFVTNSSSSSYVISKTTGGLQTKEQIYSYIRDLFLEWEHKKKMISMFYNYAIPLEKLRWAERKEIAQSVKSNFDFNIFDTNCYDDSEWYKCLTYSEFERYWSNKFQGKEYPDWIFKIIEYPEFDEYGVCDWYYPCLSSDFDGTHCIELCDHYDKSTCVNGTIGNTWGNISPEMVQQIMGKYCVVSESGYLPQYVTNRLASKCKFYCHHMG